ncbi:MAG: phosphoglucosamine mutase [Verrucomicrobiota bacterium]
MLRKLGMKRKYFGTDGIRGKFGEEPMTSGFLYRTGKAAAEHFALDQPPLFIIGRDTRESGPILESAFCQGVESAGGHCHRIGVVPTAAVAVNTVTQNAAAGAMISASHNPYSDNGIKLFNPQGFKLSDDVELSIEQRIDACDLPELEPENNLSFFTDADATKSYHETIRSSLPEKFSLDGSHIVVDASHGAAYQTTPDFLESLGATVTRLNTDPDGTNINANCGSQHTESICATVQKLSPPESASSCRPLGLAHDGDADRLIMIDENGVPLDGDELLAILGVGMLKAGNLTSHTVAATVMSNLGLDACIAQHGGKVIRTDVGDRYILEAMQQHGLSLGGEQSGHMIFLDHLPTGDGLMSSIQALRFIQESGQPLSELRKILKKFPQKLYNLKVREKRSLEEMPEVHALIQQAEVNLGDTGRIFFRYSGTENLARLLVEAKDANAIEPLAQSILTPLQESIGL